MLDELLRQLRLFAFQGADLTPQRLVDWLRRQTGAHIAVVDERGRVEASTAGLTPGTIAALRLVLAQVADGRVRAVATRAGDLQVQCEALGRRVPRAVLVVAGASPLTREASALASHAGVVLDVVRRLRHADDLAGRYQWMAERHRLAIFMALMAADVTMARRMTAGSVPPLLEADAVRVHLLRCPPQDRVRLADTYQDELGYHGRGLMVRCPVYDDHLICLVPEDEAQEHGDLSALVSALVRDNPGYELGISVPHPLAATAEAYDQARHALAVARQLPGRVATYQGHASLARVLPRRPALAWAGATLRPIGSAPRLTHDVARLALAFPRSGVARLLGISRNTVTSHLRQVEQALGLDLHRAHDRAELALALAVGDVPPPVGEVTPVPSLDGLLTTEEAVGWARAFLKPLHDDRAVVETLRAWVEADTDAQRTARVLGISRATVRARLRTAERLLGLNLLTPGPGTHDLVHAFRIVDRAP
ncbi:helix-turn-helix domain-containing protein [Nonomuraea sp. K274]|uniref:Helix-turn-helix domain-containing protein n=1 Tax=Nonomuraea cypriaca TaxID=1187855 RepID=A0A931EYY3_9ACTN|nr:helix-turn-helix domain-containing protein [Nonomuraea cypriaca]MBF8184553.1 helix-turn-helix domain-containing protein [Nonomuraea cypriaca]